MASYAIGGEVSGLASGKSLVLQNNGGDDLTQAKNGAFEFATKLAAGVSYAVTIATQPNGQLCTVHAGSGTANALVSNIKVECADTPVTGAGLSTFAGNWVLRGICLLDPSGSGSSQLNWRFTVTSATTLTDDQGMLLYASNDCSGAGHIELEPAQFKHTLRTAYSSGGTPIYRVTSVATLTGDVQKRVYCLPKPNMLCVMGDAGDSSDQQIAELIASSTPSETHCGTRR